MKMISSGKTNLDSFTLNYFVLWGELKDLYFPQPKGFNFAELKFLKYAFQTVFFNFAQKDFNYDQSYL
jgi:hypothetical protein